LKKIQAKKYKEVCFYIGEYKIYAPKGAKLPYLCLSIFNQIFAEFTTNDRTIAEYCGTIIYVSMPSLYQSSTTKRIMWCVPYLMSLEGQQKQKDGTY